jgi:hypothetical protein
LFYSYVGPGKRHKKRPFFSGKTFVKYKNASLQKSLPCVPIQQKAQAFGEQAEAEKVLVLTSM